MVAAFEVLCYKNSNGNFCVNDLPLFQSFTVSHVELLSDVVCNIYHDSLHHVAMFQQIRNAVMLVQRYVMLNVHRLSIRCGTSTQTSFLLIIYRVSY